ncbi:alpha/beta hydrolase [Microbacterium sp. LjRoot45]|uniref:alpha/beta hydrolase n=1 Tax=Microbacterium sp. LjRoot45 TaxID=3342329 RepID=UPI003ECDB6C8
MPLDPYFTQRLRRHRRYLLRQVLGRLRDTLPWWLAPRSAASPPPRPSEMSSPVAAATGSTPEPTRVERAARARARHRRAAWAWDRDELASAGVRGPDLPITDHVVPVDGFPAVTVRVYRPAADDRVRPAALYFYGGAFRIGGIDYPTTDATCRRRAAEADVVVISVSYALAPEHRFPTQVEQGMAALEWVVGHSEELGVDADRLAVTGTSAGGAIAAAVTLMNRDRGGRPLRLQVLEVPVTDLTGRHVDLIPTWRMGVPALLVFRELRSIARTYLARREDARNPYASPLRATDHTGLPPALIMTAEYDTLRRDGAAYGARLRASGVDATVVRYLGVTHDTPIYTAALPAARSWHAQVVAALRSLHA